MRTSNPGEATATPMLIVTYALALWLGLYLMRLGTVDAGLGLVVYAVGLVLLDVPGWWLFTAVLPTVCWAIAVRRIWGHVRRTKRRERWLLLTASIFLALSLGAVLLPMLPRDVALVALGVDLLLVGYAVAVLDADNSGEMFLPAAVRSLAAAGVVALIFGAQVGFVMIIEGPLPGLRLLLIEVVGLSVALTVFAAPLNNAIDRLLLPANVGKARQTLRNVGEALPQADEAAALMRMDEATFTKHTRRALSNLNRYDKLVTSPLMRLPMLRCEAPLERAAELRALLVSRIEQLRPRPDGYGVTDEWRYYNALYYPYVVGMRPYSRRFVLDDADDETRAVLAWFQGQVPERTLYNWQNAAAAVIAQDLRG